MIKYGLNDTKRIKKKQVTLILYSFTPSDMNFQTYLLPKMILAKKNSQKKTTHLDHSYLKYTLAISYSSPRIYRVNTVSRIQK